jgi:hypothetical protein
MRSLCHGCRFASARGLRRFAFEKGSTMSTALYYPGPPPADDDEFGGAIRLLVHHGWVTWANCHFAYNRSLGRVDPQSKLYLFCHGHDELPMFETEKGVYWKPGQMACRMFSDNLSEQHREIEMLVCNAGLSTTSKAAAAERTKAYNKFMAAQSAETAAKFARVAEKGPGPADFTKKSQTLPLCAQFVQEMKSLGYNHLRTTAYKEAVAMYQDSGPQYVLLAPDNLPRRLSTAADKVVWA